MNTIITCDPRENHLLCALANSELEQLVPHLELVTLSQSEVLYEVGDKLQHIYFPVTATASFLSLLEDGSMVEVARVSKEGLLEVSAILGRDNSFTQAIVSVGGTAYRISLQALQNALSRSGGRRAGKLKLLILRYAQTLFIQISQIIACNRRHTIEQQLSSWLLSMFDRTNSNSLSITQETIGLLLGVRRESITLAAKKLQDAGMINYYRGHIELTNREQLEHTACECYRVMRAEMVRLEEDSKAA